jgi:putative DNA primase/helicase
MMNPQNETAEFAAAWYVENGRYPVRVAAGDKRPLDSRWQKPVDGGIVALADNANFANRFRGCNVGLLMGEASGWLVCVDLDCPEAVDRAAEFLPATDCVTGRTGQPGRHWWFISRDCPTMPLADKQATGSASTVELRSKGCQVVVWPSIHPDGSQYEKMPGVPATVSADELVSAVERLHAAVLADRGHDEPEITASTVVQSPTGTQNDEGRPGDVFNARGYLRPVLERQGWVWLRNDGRQDYWLRPGKVIAAGESQSPSATYDGTTFYVFSSSVPEFEAENGYSRFETYARLEHGGDRSTAAGVLRQQGFGGNGQLNQVDLSGLTGSTPASVVSGQPEDRKPRRRLISRCVADVEAKPLEWLWPGLIPIGKMTLFSGDPGLGKSFVTVDMASRVSRGKQWPVSLGGQPVSQSAGSVVILACEDDVEDTVRPRLDRANANVARIHVIDCVEVEDSTKGFALDVDLPLLEAMIEDIGDVRLLIIDPISAYCGNVDSHKNAEVRGILMPLTSLAAKHKFAIVAINHLTKGSGKAIYRSLGSVGFAATARVGLNFYKDPDDENRRLILVTKMNLAKEADGLAYSIDGDVGEVGSVRWSADAVKMTADEMQARETEALQKPNSGESQSKVDDATDFIRETLAYGPVPSKQIFGDAKELGIAQGTLRRAYERMGGKPEKSKGEKGAWLWPPPPDFSLLIESDECLDGGDDPEPESAEKSEADSGKNGQDDGEDDQLHHP